jgi:hypothetical protein
MDKLIEENQQQSFRHGYGNKQDRKEKTLHTRSAQENVLFYRSGDAVCSFAFIVDERRFGATVA